MHTLRLLAAAAAIALAGGCASVAQRPADLTQLGVADAAIQAWKEGAFVMNTWNL